jgi:hypothetical protein
MQPVWRDKACMPKLQAEKFKGREHIGDLVIDGRISLSIVSSCTGERQSCPCA